MNLQPRLRARGFTLIELLVVITIIAVLAGLAIPTANIVLRKAKETQARAAVQGLVVAIKGYQTEYNRLPAAGGSGGGPPPETPLDTDSSNSLVAILLGRSKEYNPREISFYDPPIAKNEANGLIPASGGGGGGGDSEGKFEVVDPWSTPKKHQNYHVVLDYSGDHSVPNPVKSEASKFNSAYIGAESQDLSTDIAVYSDNDPRTPSTTRKPITSW